MPDRSRSPGVSRLPAAATTDGAWMTTREISCVCGSVYVPSTPTAAPSSVRIRLTQVLGSSFAPASDAS
jgi:hypothetical protein